MLAKITKEQAHKLTDSMNNIFTEYEFTCYLGLKHTAPFIEDAVEEMKRDGIEQTISIVLARIILHLALKRIMTVLFVFQKKSVLLLNQLNNGMMNRSLFRIGQTK